jgi:spore germination protein
METPKTVLICISKLLTVLMLVSTVVACLLLLLAAPSLVAKPEAAPETAPQPNTPVNASRQRVMGARPLRLAYYVDNSRAFESLPALAPEITLLAPQCFWVDAEGFVHGAIPEPLLQLAHRLHLPLMPLVINPGFDRGIASALLRDPEAQERAVMYLAYLAKRDDVVGFQINFENIDPADRDNFTLFVRRAAARLCRDGRLLSVAVVPRFSDTDTGRSPTGKYVTGEWGAPYDYRALGNAADFLVLMAYDQHGRATAPGPIAGYDWVKEAIEYAVQRVPPAKLLLGVPLYGREWIENNEGLTSRSLSFQDERTLLARARTDAQWRPEWRSSWLQFRNGNGQHTAWFEDQRSLQEKLRLVRQYHLRGFAAWRLGFEDAAFWKVITSTFRGKKASSPSPTGQSGTRKNSRRLGARPK